MFNLYQKRAGGTNSDELLLRTPHDKQLQDWSADGRFILYHEDDPITKADLWVLPLFGDRKPMRLVGELFTETSASLSPDGHWIAYTSDESNDYALYVQDFPASGRKWRVSPGNGTAPRWRADGKELFYDRGGRLMSVDLTGSQPGREFRAGAPRELFSGLLNLPPHKYDLTPDGQRFLVLTTRTLEAGPAPIVVVVNWQEELKRLLPGN